MSENALQGRVFTSNPLQSKLFFVAASLVAAVGLIGVVLSSDAGAQSQRTVADFGILAGTTVTNIGPSAITGNVSVSRATVVPVRARPAAHCNWTANDPSAVIHACTARLGAENTPEPWMYFNRGLAYKTLGQLENAYLDYSRAIELNPAFGAAYTNRGNVQLLRNDVAAAMADFRMALELDPNDQVARENLEAIEAALRKIGADKSGRGAATGPAR